MVNFGSLTAEIIFGVWGTPANFNGFRVLASLLQRRRSMEVNQALHGVWPSPGLVHYIYIFGGSCSLTEFCQVQNSLCVQVLRSPILAALLHSTGAASASLNLRRATRNGIRELSQTAPPTFGWAAITLGIVPHSSFVYFLWHAYSAAAKMMINYRNCFFYYPLLLSSSAQQPRPTVRL